MTTTPDPQPASPWRQFLADLRSRWLQVTLAFVAILALVAATGVAVVAWQSASAAQEGTRDQLDDAGTGGAWHSLSEPAQLFGGEISPEDATSLDFSDLADTAKTRSWLLQISTRGVSSAGFVQLFSDNGARTAAQIPFTNGSWESTSYVTTVDDNAVARLSSSATVEATVHAVAYWTLPTLATGLPSPGGSMAIPAHELVNLGTGLGATVADVGAAIALSPRGLGAVPRDGVAAVWAFVTVAGDGALRHADAAGTAGTTIVSTSPIAQGGALSLLILDESGLAYVHLDEGLTEVSISVVGWVAAQDAALNHSIIERGVLPVPPQEISGGSDEPLGTADIDLGTAVALYATTVTSSADPTTLSPTILSSTGDDRDDTVRTRTPIAGRAHALVVAASDAELATESPTDLSDTTLLGYFPSDTNGAGELSITFTTPSSNAEINLGEAGGEFTVGGTLSGDVGDLKVVTLKLADRVIGAADIRVVGDGFVWSLTTSAPPGSFVITAVAETWHGSSAQDEVTISVTAAAATATVVSPEVVILSADDLENARAEPGDRLIFSDAVPFTVGSILNAPQTTATPAGLLKRVTSLQRVSDEIVVTLENVALTDAIAQTDTHLDSSSDVAAREQPRTTNNGMVSQTAGYAHPAAAGQLSLPSVSLDAKLTASAGVSEAPKKQTISVDVTGTVGAEVSIPGGDTKGLPLGGSAKIAQKVNLTIPPRDNPSDVTVAAKFVATMSVKAKLESSINCEIVIDLLPKWGKRYSPLRTFALSTTTTVTETQKMAISGSVSGSITVPAPQPWRIGAGVIPLGPVTLVIINSMTPELTFKLEFTQETSTEFTTMKTLKIGFRFDDGKFAPIAESEFKSSAKPTSSSALALEATVSLKFRMALYDVAGPYAKPAVTLKYTVKRSGEGSQLSQELAASGQVVIGAEFSLKELLKIDISYSEEATIKLPDYVLWSSDDTNEDEDSGGTGSTTTPENSSGSTSAVGSGNRPLAIVLDLSGSMVGDRLETAKTSLSRVIASQPIGSELGIWTYPSDDNCGPGSYAVPVQQIVSTSDLIAQVNALEANGGTPTGAALRSVANDLSTQGYTGATILLVSDGESNCGEPACVVADELRTHGFDLQVESVGFSVTEAGKAELECVAQATGGSYTPAENTEELEKTITELGRASIAVNANALKELLPNETQHITVSVTNPSSRDAAQVQLQLTFPDIDTIDGGIAINPTSHIQLGNIPPGGEMTRTFDVTFPGGIPKDSTVDYRVSAWGAEIEAQFVDQSFRVVSEVSEPSSPGIIGGADRSTVVIVGDGASYSPSANETDCDSRVDRSATLGEQIAVIDASCSTSGISELEHGGTRDDGAVTDPQLAVLQEHDAISSVVVSLGARDIGLPELTAQCAAESCTLQSPEVQRALIAATVSDFSPVFNQIWIAANATDATVVDPASVNVVVTALPHLFSDTRGKVCTADYDANEVIAIRTVVNALNLSLAASVEKSAASGYGVYFDPYTAEMLLPENDICSGSTALEQRHDGTWMLSEEGNAVAAASLLRWSAATPPSDDLPGEIAQDAAVAAHERSTFAHEFLAGPSRLLSLPARVTVATGGSTPAIVQRGQQLIVTSHSLAPHSQATLLLRTLSVEVLGTAVVDAEGTVVFDVILPSHVGIGDAALTIVGVDSDATTVLNSTEIAVSEPLPNWAGWLVLLASVLILAAVTTAVIARIRMSSRT